MSAFLEPASALNQSTANRQITRPAPAKINLFLHITGQRADGYHTLQTVFQFLDQADVLGFRLREDNCIVLADPISGLDPESDLVVRAARLLQQQSGVACGATITRQKNLPIGGGIGGGSSNAATTLVALSELWNLRIGRQQLLSLALQLGADVPVFVHGQACWAEGVGEQFTPVELPEPWFLVLIPSVNVSTSEIFCDSQLTRNCSPITIRDFLAGSGENVFEPVVARRHPEVAEALDWLRQHLPETRPPGSGHTRPAMSGTGCCVFVPCESHDAALKLLGEKPSHFAGFVARGCNQSPLYRDDGYRHDGTGNAGAEFRG